VSGQLSHQAKLRPIRTLHLPRRISRGPSAHRIDLLALSAPCRLAAIVLLIAAVFGLIAVSEVDVSLSQLFRSDNARVQTFEEVTRPLPVERV